MKLLYTALFAALLLTSCNKNGTSIFDPATKGPISVEFDNIAGDENLMLNSGSYINASNESFHITKLKYYVSNFAFTKTDGTVYTIPQNESYFLIDESDGSEHLAEFEIPEGEYKTLSFMIGVDSLRSTMDIADRTGVLDPTAAGGDMYWSWNSGYIFLKLEGSSPASTETGNVFMYHIGGFGGYDAPTINNIRTVTLDLSARGNPQVKNGKKTNVHLMADIMKLFDNDTPISIAAHSSVMSGDFSAVIANNYMHMFQHDHTEN